MNSDKKMRKIQSFPPFFAPNHHINVRVFEYSAFFLLAKTVPLYECLMVCCQRLE